MYIHFRCFHVFTEVIGKGGNSERKKLKFTQYYLFIYHRHVLSFCAPEHP